MYSDCKAINHKRAECTHKTQTQKPQHQATHGRGVLQRTAMPDRGPFNYRVAFMFLPCISIAQHRKSENWFLPGIYRYGGCRWVDIFFEDRPIIQRSSTSIYIYIYTYTIAPMPGFGAQGCRGNCFCTSRRYCDPEPSTLDPNPCHLNPIHL